MRNVWKAAVEACEVKAAEHHEAARKAIYEESWATIRGDLTEKYRLSNIARAEIRKAFDANELPAILKQVWIELKRK